MDALKLDRVHEAEGAGRPWLLWAIAGAAIAVLLVAAVVWRALSPGAVSVRTITVASGGAGSGGPALNASGYVVAQQQATVAAEITGMVTAVYVNEGDKVRIGQVIAQLDDSAARATLEAAQSQLEADRAVPRQYQAQLDLDRRTLERMRALIKANAVSQTTLDGAIAAVGVDQAQLSHAIGQVGVDEKNVAVDKTQLSFTVIRAPFSGVVTERYAHPGEMISPQAVGGFTQTGICKVVDMSSLEIEVDVNEAYVQRAHTGQKAEAILDAYPDWSIPAHVIGVVPTANQQKATVKVRVGFDKLDPRILPQMGVQVRFLSSDTPIAAAPIIRVPASAVRRDGAQTVLFVVEGGHAAKRVVVARPTQSGDVVIRGGLDGGEQVIVSAEGELKDGVEVHEQ